MQAVAHTHTHTIYIYIYTHIYIVDLVVKNMPGNARGIKAMGSIAGSGRSLGEGYGNPLQYSCLGNLKHSESWRATVHGVTKICTRLSTSPPHT